MVFFMSNEDSSNRVIEDLQNILNELDDLKQDIDIFKKDLVVINQNNVSKFETEVNKASSFCSWDFIDFFISDDFEEKFIDVINKLPRDSRVLFKWYFLRAMVIPMIKRESLFSSTELKSQKQFSEFQTTNVKDNMINGFKFHGEYNLHPFIDLNLSKDDEKFLSNKDIIDAGAFTGDTSLPLSQLTSKNVYSFEPFKESFDILKRNVEDNNIKNIIPVNKSLGNINGERTLFLSGDNVQGITSKSDMRNYDNVLKVQETTVDCFVKENNLNVGYITVDVEGAEMDLLEGAINTIKSQKPILTISIYHQVSDYFNIIPWIDSLNLGYKFKIVKEQPWTFLADTIVHCTPY